jgi:hypothetical protein
MPEAFYSPLPVYLLPVYLPAGYPSVYSLPINPISLYTYLHDHLFTRHPNQGAA